MRIAQTVLFGQKHLFCTVGTEKSVQVKNIGEKSYHPLDGMVNNIPFKHFQVMSTKKHV